MDRITKAGQRSSDDIFDEYVPMADPQRFRGTDALTQYTSGDMAYVIEIEFVGRRPVCNFTEPVLDLIVDDLIRAEIIERSPSKM